MIFLDNMKINMNEKKNMPVVLFVGGTGSRIREETISKPKPMVEVGEVPLLWHVMKIYKHYGFNKFILTLGYKGEYIRNFLAKDKRGLFSEFEIILAETGENTKTGGRLLKAAKYIKNDIFLCTYGDGVSDINLDRLLKHHYGLKNVIGTITGVNVPHKFGIISHTKKGILKSYKKGHLMKEPINAGFMVLNKSYLKYLKKDCEVEEPFNKLAETGKMGVYFHKGNFGAIDTYKDLEDLNKIWVSKPFWKVWKD